MKNSDLLKKLGEQLKEQSYIYLAELWLSIAKEDLRRGQNYEAKKALKRAIDCLEKAKEQM